MPLWDEKKEETKIGFLKIEPVTHVRDPETTLSAVERAKNRVKMIDHRSNPYLDLRFLRPTTCTIERLFSVAGYCITKERKAMLPINVEMQIFLHVNQDLWSIAEFHKAMKAE